MPIVNIEALKANDDETLALYAKEMQHLSEHGVWPDICVLRQLAIGISDELGISYTNAIDIARSSVYDEIMRRWLVTLEE